MDIIDIKNEIIKNIAKKLIDYREYAFGKNIMVYCSNKIKPLLRQDDIKLYEKYKNYVIYYRTATTLNIYNSKIEVGVSNTSTFGYLENKKIETLYELDSVLMTLCEYKETENNLYTNAKALLVPDTVVKDKTTEEVFIVSKTNAVSTQHFNEDRQIFLKRIDGMIDSRMYLDYFNVHCTKATKEEAILFLNKKENERMQNLNSTIKGYESQIKEAAKTITKYRGYINGKEIEISHLKENFASIAKNVLELIQ